MPEGTRAAEDHRHAVLVADLDGLVVTDAAAGLDDGGDAGFAGVLHGIAAREGEERVRGDDSALRPLARPLE